MCLPRDTIAASGVPNSPLGGGGVFSDIEKWESSEGREKAVMAGGGGERPFEQGWPDFLLVGLPPPPPLGNHPLPSCGATLGLGKRGVG